MPEFPIIFHEEITRTIPNYYEPETQVAFGYRLVHQAPGAISLTVHQQDMRTTANPRLQTESLWHFNIPASLIWQMPAANSWGSFMGSRSTHELYLDAIGRYEYIYTLLAAETDYRAPINMIQRIKEFMLSDQYVHYGGQPLVMAACCPEIPQEFLPNEHHHFECLDCGYGTVTDTAPHWRFINNVPVEETDLEREDYPIRVIGYCVDCVDEDEYEENYSEGIYDRMGDLGHNSCDWCGEFVVQDLMADLDQDTYVCIPCWGNSIECERCLRRLSPGHFRSGYSECSFCMNRPRGPQRFIQNYSYRPALVFHPMLPDVEHPLYIGMELEMTWPNYTVSPVSDKAEAWLEKLTTMHQDILFVKSDSSVTSGFEVVTHPMNPDWALQEFPFDFFQEAIDEGADPGHHSTGTHIHMDKASFSTAQLWKVLQLHDRLPDLCGKVGGRGTDSSWASWDRNSEAVRRNAMWIAKHKKEGYSNVARYSPVNVQNEATIELRYPKGGIKPKEIKKNMEWAKCLFEFTNYISVEDVKKGVLDNPGFLLGWIWDRETDYPNLKKWLSKDTLIPEKMPERTVV